MIRYDALCKVYDEHVAVECLTLTVRAGEVTTLLGPNGSGKTTALKAAAGLVRPTSGRVLLGAEELPALHAAARRALSFLPQKVGFPETLTGREVVEFHRRLRGAPAGGTEAALGLAALNGSGDRAIGTYSGGMVQRLGLAVAAVADAPILLLDEPTAALDPAGAAAFDALVERFRERGRTVFFSSHQMGDVERLADRVALLAAGRLVATFTQDELRARLAARGRLRLTLAGEVDASLLERIGRIAPGTSAQGRELVVPGPPEIRPAILAALAAAGATLTALTSEEGRLDALYADLLKEAGS